MTEEELLYCLDIGEGYDVEFKAADGGLPKSLWETVSAFANTNGGHIILGVAERGSKVNPVGVKNPSSMVKAFWDGHNNPQKLNIPLCRESDVQTHTVEGRTLIIIHVPRALRTQRPVYINGNPMFGAYKRNFEGDYRCSELEVRQMLRDASDDPQDIIVFENFDLRDLDLEALKSFRQRFGSRDPDHPFLSLDDKALLGSLGGWRRDRHSGQEGLTLAGLLMFGRENSLLEALPYYQLDYQERLSDDPEVRWTYRVTIDGKWEPNLFNFYYRVYGRLVNDLAIPFQLDKGAVRRGETHVHEALREALVNTLVHADHRSSRPITIIKHADSFFFQNPGRLRIPMEQLFQGGVSDPRNPKLQKMFQMIGLGEKAGSGFQKILRAWEEQQWFIPLVDEDFNLELTTVRLPMLSMIPEEVEQELRGIVGNAYTSLRELDRIALVLAHRFGVVSNADIKQYRREHPREIGERLKYLVEQDWLKRTGHGPGTRYFLPSTSSTDLFERSSEHYRGSSEHYGLDSEHYGLDSEHYNEHLWKIAAAVREKSRTNKELVRGTILRLCSEDYLLLRALSQLLGRSPDTIRTHYLNPMVEESLLELRYPDQPNHPKQAYKTKEN